MSSEKMAIEERWVEIAKMISIESRRLFPFLLSRSFLLGDFSCACLSHGATAAYYVAF